VCVCVCIYMCVCVCVCVYVCKCCVHVCVCTRMNACESQQTTSASLACTFFVSEGFSFTHALHHPSTIPWPSAHAGAAADMGTPRRQQFQAPVPVQQQKQQQRQDEQHQWQPHNSKRTPEVVASSTRQRRADRQAGRALQQVWCVNCTSPCNACHCTSPCNACHCTSPYNACHCTSPCNACHCTSPYNACHCTLESHSVFKAALKVTLCLRLHCCTLQRVIVLVQCVCVCLCVCARFTNYCVGLFVGELDTLFEGTLSSTHLSNKVCFATMQQFSTAPHITA
jgi:hypothetical protein